MLKRKNEEIIKAYHAETNEFMKEELKNELFIQNKKLPYFIAKKYTSSNMSLDELASIATYGMLKAFNTYDPTKDILFATYATRCMANEVLMVLRKKRLYEVTLDGAIAKDESGNELTIADVLASETTQDIEKVEQRDIIQTLLEKAKPILNKVEYVILENRLKDEPLNQRQLAETLGLSQSYISRLDNWLTPKLRELAIEAELIEPADYSGIGVTKVTKREKVEEPKVAEVEEYPVITYILESKGDEEMSKVEVIREKLKELGLDTVKAKIAYLVDNYPELSASEMGLVVGKNTAAVYTYKHMIKKERLEKKASEIKAAQTPVVAEVEVSEAPTQPVAEVEKPSVTEKPARQSQSPVNIDMTMDGVDVHDISNVFDLVRKLLNEGQSYKLYVSVESKEEK